jgi:hypothetical protein
LEAGLPCSYQQHWDTLKHTKHWLCITHTCIWWKVVFK